MSVPKSPGVSHMTDRELRLSRRKFLAGAAALTLAGSATGTPGESAPAANFLTRPPKPATTDRKPLAVLTTVYRPMSHSYHIAGRFLLGYPRNGAQHVPSFYVKGMMVDQTPDN